jgi:hypothetical protein
MGVGDEHEISGFGVTEGLDVADQHPAALTGFDTQQRPETEA